eukprot:10332180-Ditylum_brightwellii.AAC.1
MKQCPNSNGQRTDQTGRVRKKTNWGHKLFQCPLKKGKGRGGGGRKGKCTLRRKNNNATKDCFKDPRNADKVPSWWRRGKGGSGSGNNGKANKETGMYCQEVEFILAAPVIKFPATLKLLKDWN